ncbi:MAG: DUF4835 family protein [Marinilabiliaceae bacterium]|nr:DUF4835 family protein [Marinilabiliaceae bacterium]
MKIEKLIISIVLYSMFMALPAQEFRCMVQVSAPSIQGTNRAIFEDMQKTILEFMNNQQWTDNIFKTEERIDCSILINIREQLGSDEFKGTMQIQARRPVYNSGYNTLMLNLQDDNVSFRYIEYQSLIYNPNSIESNLVAILSYYAFIILGYDYDSFSLRGGTPYFQKAQNIVNLAQSSREGGWSSFDGTKNRYWLVENLLNENHSQFRQFMYQYHRRGLDMMSEKPDEGRAAMATGFEQVQRVYRQRPTSYVLIAFFDAKREELLNVFKQSPSIEKGKVVTLLSEIDPAHSSKYQQLLSDK